MKKRTDAEIFVFRVAWLGLLAIFVGFLWISLATHDPFPIIFTAFVGITLGFFAPGLEKNR